MRDRSHIHHRPVVEAGASPGSPRIEAVHREDVVWLNNFLGDDRTVGRHMKLDVFAQRLGIEYDRRVMTWGSPFSSQTARIVGQERREINVRPPTVLITPWDQPEFEDASNMAPIRDVDDR